MLELVDPNADEWQV